MSSVLLSPPALLLFSLFLSLSLRCPLRLGVNLGMIVVLQLPGNLKSRMADAIAGSRSERLCLLRVTLRKFATDSLVFAIGSGAACFAAPVDPWQLPNRMLPAFSCWKV